MFKYHNMCEKPNFIEEGLNWIFMGPMALFVSKKGKAKKLNVTVAQKKLRQAACSG